MSSQVGKDVREHDDSFLLEDEAGCSNGLYASMYNRQEPRPRQDTAYSVIYVMYMLTVLVGGVIGFAKRNPNFFAVSTEEYLQVPSASTFFRFNRVLLHVKHILRRCG